MLNPFFQHFLAEVRLDEQRAMAEVQQPPTGSDGLSYFLGQQQAVGEARMARKLEQRLQQRVNTLTEETKEQNETTNDTTDA